MKPRLLLLPFLILLSAALACTLPGSVGADEKRPPANAGTPQPPLTPLPTELVASPMPTLAAPPTAAAKLETGEDVRQFMLFSFKRWHTLWADLTVDYYAGDGSTTPVQSMRNQVWISQPDQMRAISGPNGGAPERIFVMSGNAFSENNGAVMQTGPMTTYEPPLALSDTVYPHPLEGWFGTPAGSLIFPQSLAQRMGEYAIVGQEAFAGREAIVVEWSREPGVVIDRFWVDAGTGILLRWLNFSKPGGGALNSEMVVTSLLLDAPMPAQAFFFGLPWPGEFYSGVDGLPAQ